MPAAPRTWWRRHSSWTRRTCHCSPATQWAWCLPEELQGQLGPSTYMSLQTTMPLPQQQCPLPPSAPPPRPSESPTHYGHPPSPFHQSLFNPFATTKKKLTKMKFYIMLIFLFRFHTFIFYFRWPFFDLVARFDFSATTSWMLALQESLALRWPKLNCLWAARLLNWQCKDVFLLSDFNSLYILCLYLVIWS